MQHEPLHEIRESSRLEETKNGLPLSIYEINSHADLLAMPEKSDKLKKIEKKS